MPRSTEPSSTPAGTFASPPDPAAAGTLDEFVERLKLLKVWAGSPSYETITGRVNAAWTAAGVRAGELTRKNTVADCFRLGRRRLNTDLVVAVVRALHPNEGYVTQWRQALRVLGGEAQAAAQVRVQDTLPQDMEGFTGRAAELEALRGDLRVGLEVDGVVLISAIAGMAGVGKTQLAIHIGHELVREAAVDRALFVNLRGFHPDPAQPPADPAAVLDGFLRLLGIPGQAIPHGLPARIVAYRERLAGTRTLVVLDNAATADQVLPLLPETPGCPTLVTSRRRLTDSGRMTHLVVDVFAAQEAVAFLTRAVAGVPTGRDPRALERIAHRCGYLPLALGLVAGRVRRTSGWTLSDHADWLDERCRDRSLDAGVEHAFDLSYEQLPVGRQRLLRRTALHPGQDIDAHAAAALADTDLDSARSDLADLHRDHLLQRVAPDRYTLHDLLRTYASRQARDQDPAPVRRAAQSRLFDYYLATAAAAMDVLHPAESEQRPRIGPGATPTPQLTDPEAAITWLDTERPNLVAVAAHTATAGWPTHTIHLSNTLLRYLNSGYATEAVAIHGHASRAAHDAGDPAGRANALVNLGAAHMQLGRFELAAEHFKRTLALFEEIGDRSGQVRSLGNLGIVEERLSRYRSAAEHLRKAVVLFDELEDRPRQARALTNLGIVEEHLTHYPSAVDCQQRALALFRGIGDRTGEASALSCLGLVEVRLGQYGPAGEHLRQALDLYQQAGHRLGEAMTLDNIGTLHTRLGQPVPAFAHRRRALAIFRATGTRHGEAFVLNGLGETALIAGRVGEALENHAAAHSVAVEIGARHQEARAHAGLGRAHHTRGDLGRARSEYERAYALYTQLDILSADQIRKDLGTILHP
jgi:tetratricopeptide (TPR) repeat protein